VTEKTGPAVPTAIRRQQTPSTELTRHLLQFLLSGDVAPGQKIPSERQLAEALGVGRSGVREAIKSLSLLGLLDVRQGDGTYMVGSTSNLLPEVIEWGLLLGERSLLDLVEVREHLEVFIAGLAAERHTPQHVAELLDAERAMSTAGSEVGRYVAGDVQFHRTLADATGNGVLMSLSHSFRSLMQVWAARCVAETGDTAALAAEHRPILRAVQRADAAAARKAMAKHMKTANTRLMHAMPSADGTATDAVDGDQSSHFRVRGSSAAR